jgi:aminoglycoside phosphotransferase family enzyme
MSSALPGTDVAQDVLPADATIEEKVCFLSNPATYSSRERRIEVIETHFSWIFLTTARAYKLKKPSCGDGFDFRSIEARRRNAVAELRLDRRLARKTYLGIVALMREPDGTLKLGGGGVALDWLVRMVRLDDNQMLDRHLVLGSWRYTQLEAIAQRLAAFFAGARRASISPPMQIARIKREIHQGLTALIRAEEPRIQMRAIHVARSLNAFVARRGNLLRRRVEQRRIVDGHGDLRPEHICVKGLPQIIDCLEFRPDLRLLDPVGEIAFLTLECARLGSAPIESRLLRRYRDRTGDRPPAMLTAFYAALNALMRARLSVEHITDPGRRTPEHWLARAASYLGAAQSHCRRLSADLDQRTL